MNRIKLIAILLVATVVAAVAVVQVESNEKVQPAKVKPKPTTEIKPTPASILQTLSLTGSKQGYRLVTDVLDGFAGESESDNYRIPVNSGGQPSAGGISESDNYMVRTGYVHATYVKRGDATGDGLIDLGDLLLLVSYLYKGGPAPCPMEAGDINCDGVIDLGDILYIVSYLYKGGPPPAC